MLNESTQAIILDNVINFDSPKIDGTTMNINSVSEILSPVYIKIKIENHEEHVKKFPEYLKENIHKIAELEEYFNHQASTITLAQINKALACMKFYQQTNQINIISPQRWAYINGHNHISLYEIFIDIYTAILSHMSSCIFHCTPTRQYLKEFLENGLNTLIKIESINQHPNESKYGTQIIFDSSDLNAALYHLDFAVEDKSSPWRIRCCWVQECLRKKFYDIIQTKSTTNKEIPLSETVMAEAKLLGAEIIQNGSTTLLIGVNQKQINCTDVVFVNFFRTPKEALTLINVNNSVQCASIWTENISIALEMAQQLNAANIWINSNGIVDPSVPFTFGEQIIYGSEMGPLQQYAGQTTIDANAMVKENYEMALIANYSMAKQLEKKIFYVTSTLRPNNERRIFATLLKDIKNQHQQNLIANMAINKFKTICIPFGSIFAN